MQKHALQKIIEEEKKLQAPIAASLEAPVQTVRMNDEVDYWEWVNPPLPDRLEDIIPDEKTLPLAA